MSKGSSRKKSRKVRNRTKDWIMDYYQTGRRFDEENRARQDGREKSKGLKDLNSFELACIAVIVLGSIGCIIRYVIL